MSRPVVSTVTGTVYRHEADLIDSTMFSQTPGSSHVVGHVTVTARVAGEDHSWRVAAPADAPAIGSSVTLTITADGAA